jgi:subtilase family serine protease
MNNPILKPFGTALFALAVLFTGSVCAAAQTQATHVIAPRITSAIDNTSRVALTGSRPPRAVTANDIGVLSPETQLQGMMLVFNRTAAQQADLDALIAAQQDPSSPQYHQWLTPAQFGARFGVADSDLAAAQSWLQQQGFTVDGVANSRDRIHFSGTAAQVNSAFATSLHLYRAPGETESHYAPSTELALPAALAPNVLGVTNLSSFRPTPRLIHSTTKGAQPNFTSSTSGNHFITPGDIATIYDVNTVYASATGTGQSIAILGQSAIYSSDITNFLNAAGIAVRLPTLVLVPNTGASTVYKGDESESDLDVEWSSAVAKGAAVYFVYAGANGDVFDSSLEYAINNDIAPIISSSYGACEPALGSSYYSIFNTFLAQAATQGQTVIAAAGDSGSSDCYGEYTSANGSNYVTQNEQLAVDFPASSQYVTGLGGTEFPSTYTVSGNNAYFAPQGSSDVISSALSYIPEQAWNDDSSTNGIASGGGGVSIYTVRPNWQATTVPGITAVNTALGNSTYRLVPDIALDSSPASAPLAYCTSDTSSWVTGQTGSCSSGFRDASSGDLTVAGGTSFAAPIFAGMLALINQSKGYVGGQGLINPALYTLASTPATYAAAFHDTTTGGNQCLAGSSYCNGTTTASSYLTATGYDLATGLGSIDLGKLVAAWPANTVTTNSKFTLAATTATTPTTTTALPNPSGTSTITVTPIGGYTGTVQFRVFASANITGVCYSVPNATITGTAAVTSTVTITTNNASCSTSTVPLVKGSSGTTLAETHPAPTHTPWKSAPLAALAGLLCLVGFTRRKSLRGSLALGLLLVLSLSGLGLAGCSNSSNVAAPVTTTTTTTTTTVTTPTGTYALTVVGYNPTNSTIAATTSFNLTIN